MKKFIKIILLIICSIVFIFSAYKIYYYLKEENASKKLNNDLIEKIVEVPNNSEEENELPIKVDFPVLKQESNEIVGWIYSENTPINYPIVQSKDNDYYLHRLINGNYNTAGSIFMDYRNNSSFIDDNTILYGHNMKNKIMFGTLPKYKSQKYYDEHKIMYLFTPEKNYTVELFTGYTTSVDSDIYTLSKMDNNKINELIKKSNFKSDIIVTEDDKIITLSTCAYDYDGARYIVMGVLREIVDQ